MNAWRFKYNMRYCIQADIFDCDFANIDIVIATAILYNVQL